MQVLRAKTNLIFVTWYRVLNKESNYELLWYRKRMRLGIQIVHLLQKKSNYQLLMCLWLWINDEQSWSLEGLTCVWSDVRSMLAYHFIKALIKNSFDSRSETCQCHSAKEIQFQFKQYKELQKISKMYPYSFALSVMHFWWCTTCWCNH